MFTQELGIDLGTANTAVVAKRRGIIAKEPSVVAVSRQTQAILAVGTAARNMIGRTPDTIIPMRPMQGGVISDLGHTTALLKHLIRKIAGSRWLRPRVIMTMPTDASLVDRRALVKAATQAGASEVELVQETLAAALGAGLPIDQPTGSLLVNIGSGTTNIAVMALGGVVVSASCTWAGDQMDEAVARCIKKDYNLLIGQPTAERVKIQFGSAIPVDDATMTITGRLLTTGTPAATAIHSARIQAAISDSLAQIDALLLSVIERTPPELLADITESGITLVGGGAMLHGLADRFGKLTGLPVRLAEAPLDAVAIGTARLLEHKLRVRTFKMKA